VSRWPFSGDRHRPSPRLPPSPDKEHRIDAPAKDGALVTVSPGTPDRLYRTLLPKKLPACPQDGGIPARVPRADHRSHERAGDPSLLRPPGQHHDLRTTAPVISAPGPSRPLRTGDNDRAAIRTHGNARSAQRRTSSGPDGPKRPVRGRPWKADGARRPRWGHRARPLYVRGHRDTMTYSATGCHTTGQRRNAPLRENSQLAGRFRWWWQVLGSNQRRLSRRFYRPIVPVRTYTS
jgi:hypothetical protein